MRFIIHYSISIILLASCATSQTLVLDAVWENPNYESRHFRKVAVFGMAKNEKDKKEFEKDAVKYLKSKGVPAVAGYTLFEDEPAGDEVNRSEIKKHLYSLGVDGVLTATPVKNISTDDEDITDEELASHAKGRYKFGQYFESRYDDLQTVSNHNYTILEANFYYLMDYNEFDGNGLVWISHFKYDLEKHQQTTMEINKYAHTVVNGLFEDQVILERK
ncbi:hypothetical protein N7E81_12540 [Reichenbachiella carrageenanivorans]|uniref:Lipoprotein n=1 Tax=Reichenbachiella carrageenanivorans TaxID=2979869 RepID=A0ABY6CWE2_9BACT|nr:hypothetical protein [Reichenbachiella carrageenanivorans]UXX78188.1 hypothetical protein N7E81_12540 [Reichenbachiella carrageenanivorans]